MLFYDKFGDNENNFQYKVMPTPNQSLVGNIVQYIGETDGTYTKGYNYECKQNTISAEVVERIEVNQTSGVTMGDFTTDVNVFKSALNPYRTWTYQFSCVGKPKEISLSRFTTRFEFLTLNRDTVFDNSRLHQYSWVDGQNNYYYTNTEIPNSDTIFYLADTNDLSVPTDTNSGWVYDNTVSRLDNSPRGMWIVGGNETPIQLADYGIYCASNGFVGDVLQVTYYKPANAVYEYQWEQRDTQPKLDLKSITGYDASKNQILKSTQGVITWTDL